jgi:uncharacterized protein YfdQ (DUF2303 family)
MAYKIQKKPLTDEEMAEFLKERDEYLLSKHKDELNGYITKAESLILENDLEGSCTSLATAFPEADIYGKILEEKEAKKKILICLDFPRKGVIKLVNAPDDF